MSELLGSFGDNELSPECLDGVEHVLKGFFLCFLYFSFESIAILLCAQKTISNFSFLMKLIHKPLFL